MNINSTNTPTRQAALTGLAVVGFLALVASGMWLAVYSARYVPATVSKIGSAAVALGSVFVPAPDAGLSVVPTASTTIAFGDATTTPATTTPSLPVAPNKPAPTVTPTAGQQTSTTQQIGGTTAPALSGYADLVVTITNVGYLTSSSTNSFVASNTVPHATPAAVQFTIKNVGTNATGSWRFSASIPTQTAYIYQSDLQQNLNPGESIDYVLGFDQATPGTGQTVSVTANFDNAVRESNTTNNSASGKLTVLGS